MEEKKVIQQEISRHAPVLASVQKSHPFIIPKNYFQNLEILLIKEVKGKTRNDIGNLSTVKDHPFDVPDGYFDKLSESILNSVNESQYANAAAAPTHFISKYKKYRIWLAAASVVLIVTFSAWFFRNENKLLTVSPVPHEVVNKNLTEENTRFLCENISELDESFVYDLYYKQHNDKETIKQKIKSSSKAPVIKPELKDYQQYMLEVSDVDAGFIENLK
ncbi:MAG: hypothetical protein H0W62_12035 [Chitinophagales bacterium]|nr:hypothetical protein [Chitinophagales bacterium]